ncbi:ATG1 transcript variant A, partial [Aphelenchoides avenae]
MGQGQSIAGKLGKYAFEQNEESCLGRGSFGVVYKGRGPKPRGKYGTVAVKIADKFWMDEYAFKELEMNRRLSQAIHRDLRGHIEKNGRLDEGDTYNIFAGTSNGLSALHGMNIIHRDLKTSNVLLKSRNSKITAKLTDFGCSRELNEGSVAMTICGTLQNLAPECLQSRQNVRYTKESDLWSLGTILYECWTGRVAFEVPPYTFVDSERPQTSMCTPPWVQQSLDGLLRRDASERLTFGQLRTIMLKVGFVQGRPEVDGGSQILVDVLCHLAFDMLVVLRLTSRHLCKTVRRNASLLARQRKFRLALTVSGLGNIVIFDETEDTGSIIVFHSQFDGSESHYLFSALKSAHDLMGPEGTAVISTTAVYAPWAENASHFLPGDWVESLVAELPSIKWSKELRIVWDDEINDEANYVDLLRSFVDRLPELEHLLFTKTYSVDFDVLRDDAFPALPSLSVMVHDVSAGRSEEEEKLLRYCFYFCRSSHEKTRMLIFSNILNPTEKVAQIVE